MKGDRGVGGGKWKEPALAAGNAAYPEAFA